RLCWFGKTEINGVALTSLISRRADEDEVSISALPLRLNSQFHGPNQVEQDLSIGVFDRAAHAHSFSSGNLDCVTADVHEQITRRREMLGHGKQAVPHRCCRKLQFAIMFG